MSLVSGPIMTIRLLNKKTKQTVWLFGDVHYDIPYQTECPVLSDSVRIDSWFKNSFIQAKKQKLHIGFHLETIANISELRNETTSTSMYLAHLRHLFARMETLNPNAVTLNAFDVRINNPEWLSFESSRHINIRSVLQEAALLKVIYDKALKSILVRNKLSPQCSERVKKHMDNMVNTCTSLPWERFLAKLRKRVETFHQNKFKLSTTKLQLLSRKIFDQYYTMKDRAADAFASLNDVYLMDKLCSQGSEPRVDYVYSGALHTMNLLMFLLNSGDYTITHKTVDVSYVESKADVYSPKWYLRNSQAILAHLTNSSIAEGFVQCVDMKGFPAV